MIDMNERRGMSLYAIAIKSLKGVKPETITEDQFHFEKINPDTEIIFFNDRVSVFDTYPNPTQCQRKENPKCQ